jgi:hypothetical protein
MAGFLIRDIAPEDLDDFQRAAVHLDSVNLPDDRDALAQIIERSRRSFAAAASGASEPAAKDRCFVFVAADRDSGQVAGTSMIFPQHGSRKAPHVYFDVIEEARYSETLDRHFAHRVLRIGYNYKGLTEIGGLVVLPEFRRHPDRLGRLLMSVRFLYIARHRAAFRDEVLSELMPPLEPDGTSLLWESLGRKFTGLDYQEADRLSQDNKEFIRSLFPQDPLYASLLPAHVPISGALAYRLDADRAEIEEADHIVGHHNEVGRMRVGVEEKLVLNLVLHHSDELARERFWFDADFKHFRQEFLVVAVDGSHQLPHPHARNELAHHHFFRAILEIDLGGRDALLTLGRALPKQIGVAGFSAKVHLPEQDTLKFAAERARRSRRNNCERLAQQQDPVHRPQVGGDQRTDSGTSDFYRDAFAALELRLIDASE